MQPKSKEKTEKTRELKGRHILMMLIAFFGVTVGVNTIFITKAVSSFTGEDVKKSYRQGLNYNETIQSRSQQADLNWTVKSNLIETSSERQRIIVRITDRNDRPVIGLTIDAMLKRPTDLAKDVPTIFTERGDGIYQAELELFSGQWVLKATATSQGQNFRFEDRFVIS